MIFLLFLILVLLDMMLACVGLAVLLVGAVVAATGHGDRLMRVGEAMMLFPLRRR